jgi:glycosyltransferase involved in cell wall biosynthesis
MLKVLALVAEPRLPDNDQMYLAMREQVDIELVKVNSAQQKRLKKFLKSYALENYDRVILDIPFKRISKQVRFIRTLPNLVIYELDACQNYIEESKWFGKFLPFYKKLGSFRLICTSAKLAEKFRGEGIDACFLQKGYDQTYLKNLGQEREIELGFIGRIASQTYSKRNNLLKALEEKEGLTMVRTEPGKAYLEALNKIKIFVSADIGLQEYMAKNFEAMACGCLLVAYRQGEEEEEEAMGLVDMENIVLYKDEQTLREKICLLREQPELLTTIARNGQALAMKNHGFDRLAEKFIQLIKPETLKPPIQKKGIYSF